MRSRKAPLVGSCNCLVCNTSRTTRPTFIDGGVLPRWAVPVIVVFSAPNMPEFNPIRPQKESQGSAAPPEPQGLPEEAVLLRIFIGEDDHHKRLSLYEAIVLKARGHAFGRRHCHPRFPRLREVQSPTRRKDSSTFNGSPDGD